MRKPFNKLFISLLFAFSFIITTYAQEDSTKAELSLSADMVSRYVWRGSMLASSPSIQPSALFSYGSFYGGFWGSSPIQGASEADWLIGYSGDYFGVCLVDYFVAADNTISHWYFNWNDGSTGHDLSAELSFPGTEKIPFRALVAYNFYGADDNHSRYYELAWMFETKKVSGEVFMGGTDAIGWYGSEGVVNTGFSLNRDIAITEKYSLPVFARVIVNPQKEDVYFVFGLTIK